MTIDIHELETRRSDLEFYYRDLRRRWEEDEDYYEGRFKVPLPAGMIHKPVPGTGRNAVDIPSQQIITDAPIVKRRRDVHGKRAQGHDDRVEAFDRAILSEMENSAATPPTHEATRQALLRGMTWLTGPFIHADKLANGDPGWITWDVEDPINVLAEPGEDPSEVFIQYKTTVAEMLQMAGKDETFSGFRADGRKPTEEIDVIKWYGYDQKDAGERSEWVSYAWWEKGKKVWISSPKETSYKYIPFIPVYSGYGRRASGAKPEQVAVSILNMQVKSMLVEQSAAFGRLGGAVAASVWGQWSAPDENTAQQVVLSGEPLAVMIVPPGVTRVEAPPPAQAAVQYLQMVNEELERTLFSGVIRGERPTGVGTAAGLAILSGQARLKFGPPLRLLQAGLAKLLWRVGPILETLTKAGNTEFEIAGHTITLADFGGDYAVEVQLMTEAPEDRDRKVTLGMQLQKAQAMPEEDIYNDYYGKENYRLALKKRMKEKVLLSDEVAMLIKEAVGLARQAAMAKVLGQNKPQSNAGGVDMLAEMNAQARQLRAAQPGTMGQVQQPGSYQDMVSAQNQMQQGPTQGMAYGQP